MNTLQKPFIPFQKSLQKQDNTRVFQAIIAAVLLLLAFTWPVPVIASGISAYLIWRYSESIRKERENTARCAGMKYILGPHLVTSIDPMESAESVFARTAQFRDDLRASGNPHAEIIPIIAHPYSPMMYGPDQVTCSWSLYWKFHSADLHNANLEWANTCPDEIRGIFMNQVIPSVQNKPAAI